MINEKRLQELEEKINNLESIICRLLAHDVTEEEKIKIIESLILNKTNK
jgi:predicted transcriptional regulator